MDSGVQSGIHDGDGRTNRPEFSLTDDRDKPQDPQVETVGGNDVPTGGRSLKSGRTLSSINAGQLKF